MYAYKNHFMTFTSCCLLPYVAAQPLRSAGDGESGKYHFQEPHRQENTEEEEEVVNSHGSN